MELLKPNILTDSQRKRIFIMTRQAGLTSEELHSLLPEWCGGNSLSSNSGISVSQANKVISALNKIIAKKHSIKGMPTEKQIKAIKTLQSLLHWGDVALERFIYRTTKKASLNSITFKDASAVISGLNRVKISFLQKKSVKSQNQNSQFA